MKTDREHARLRATYADLLDDVDAEELLPFIGALDAAHSPPPLPATARAVLDQPRWAAHQYPLPATKPGRKARPRPLRTLAAWMRGRLAFPQGTPSRRGANLHQAINAATTIVLVLGIALAAFLLLGQPARPVQGVTGRVNGNWAYPGTLDGRSGIISVTPDGTARLLIEGGFYGVTPSPDGRRLIVYGNRQPETWPDATAAALYTAEGQLLRRYTLGGATPLIPYWSPDSRRIAFFTSLGARVGTEGVFRTWLLDEHGEREVQLGRQTLVGTSSGTGVWSSRGDLLVSVIAADSNGDGAITSSDRQETWVIHNDGSAPRRLRDETAAILGWSRDGRTAYLLTADALIAVDVASGSSKVVASAADVIAALRAMATQQSVAAPDASITGFAYFPAAIAPSGDRFAVWLIPKTAEKATTAPPPYLVVLDAQGRIAGVTRGETNTWPRFTAWSPDSARIAYSTATMGNDLGSIRVVGSTTTALADTSVALATIGSNTPDGLSARWSPDGQQLTFSTNGLLEVASGANLGERRRLPGQIYGWPNWQPAP